MLSPYISFEPPLFYRETHCVPSLENYEKPFNLTALAIGACLGALTCVPHLYRHDTCVTVHL